MPVRRAGGGGGFEVAVEDGLSAMLDGYDGVMSLCCEDTVREELLLDRDWFGDFSWLCRRASGGGGGAFFCMDVGSTGSNGAPNVRTCDPTGGPESGLVEMRGGGGNGLLRSD